MWGTGAWLVGWRESVYILKFIREQSICVRVEVLHASRSARPRSLLEVVFKKVWFTVEVLRYAEAKLRRSGERIESR